MRNAWGVRLVRFEITATGVLAREWLDATRHSKNAILNEAWFDLCSNII